MYGDKIGTARKHHLQSLCSYHFASLLTGCCMHNTSHFPAICHHADGVDVVCRFSTISMIAHTVTNSCLAWYCVIHSCLAGTALAVCIGDILPHNDNLPAVMTAGNCNVGTVNLQQGLALYQQLCRCISQGKQKNSIRSHQFCLDLWLALRVGKTWSTLLMPTRQVCDSCQNHISLWPCWQMDSTLCLSHYS